MKKCWLRTALLAAFCFAFVLPGLSGCKGEIMEEDPDTRIAIDISSNDASKDWTEVAVYAWGEELFGGWPGLKLTQSTVNPNIFYSEDLSNTPLGGGNFIFSTKGGDGNAASGGAQFDAGFYTISKGQKWIYKNGAFSSTTIEELGIE